MAHTESYVDNSILTPENIPKNIKHLLKEAEQFDREGNDVMYFAVVLDDLWVNCKNACAARVMSKHDWNMMEYSSYYETKLYPIQNEVLKNLKSLNLPFYLTGGTAVKIESLHLRYLHDLD